MTLALRAVLALLLATAAAGCDRSSPATAADRRPNVILVTVDTLRADHLGFAGYERDTSPSLDQLAREGTWFPSYYSQSATTGAAHASLLTSLPPRETGVTANSQPFPADKATIMGALRERGYRAAAFVSSIVVGSKWLVQNHFDHFDDKLTTVEPHRKTRFERPAEQTVQAALDYLATRPKDEPFFLWIHLIDPHGPYEAPVDPDRYVNDKFYGKLPKDLPIGETDWEYGEIPRYQLLGDSTDANYYVARYDAEIRYMDGALGRFFGELKKRGLYDDTLIAVTADHGETLVEQGHQRYFSHGVITYEEVVRIPLVVREPHGEKKLAAVQRERPLSSLDLAPTLLELAGSPIPGGFQGRNLLRATLDPEEPIVSLGGYGTENLEQGIGTQFSVRRGPWRYIVNTKGGAQELYDHRDDPVEAKNVIAEPGKADVAALRARIDGTVGETRVAAPAPTIGEDQAAGLRALGYVE